MSNLNELLDLVDGFREYLIEKHVPVAPEAVYRAENAVNLSKDEEPRRYVGEAFCGGRGTGANAPAPSATGGVTVGQLRAVMDAGATITSAHGFVPSWFTDKLRGGAYDRTIWTRFFSAAGAGRNLTRLVDEALQPSAKL